MGVTVSLMLEPRSEISQNDDNNLCAKFSSTAILRDFQKGCPPTLIRLSSWVYISICINSKLP